MSTLLLRIAAPLQSWGSNAKFERRGTDRVPTKSGIIGLVAAALGRRRNESVEDLLALRFGVRVDKEGILLRDFHMAHEEKFWEKHEGKYAHLTTRYYLSDAVFLAGLEGDDALLVEIERALHRPVFPLFLGRRACPPEGKISLGIREGKPLLDALREEPWLISDWARRKANPNISLRIVADGIQQDSNAYFQRDIPESFDQKHRRYGFRRVVEFSIANPASKQIENPTEHDPMPALEEG